MQRLFLTYCPCILFLHLPSIRSKNQGNNICHEDGNLQETKLESTGTQTEQEALQEE